MKNEYKKTMFGYAAVAFMVSMQCCGGIVHFASYYGDHMVLQRAPERAVLWGYGTEGENITVKLSGPAGQQGVSTTVIRGVWRVTFDPVEAGGPYAIKAAGLNSSANLTDVLFGDIWLCGGQSNMEFNTSRIFNASEELALAVKFPHVRVFMAAMEMSDTELIDLKKVDLPWSVASAESVAQFSAVCWLFGRYMFDKLNYPVGLVESCWGGTMVESWSSSRALHQCGLLPLAPEDDPKNRNSVLWNAMIHPFLNMTVKGAIWYQGEANAVHHQDKYNCSFPAMIDDWRMSFHQGSGGQTAPDFPFGFVQLSTYEKGSTHDGFPEIRWHQTADTGFAPNPRMPRTFMAVAMDLPDESSPFGTIHPRDKQDVAFRLTLGARAVAYHEKDVHFRGPFPIQVVTSQVDVIITYDQPVSVTWSKDIFEICCSSMPVPCNTTSPWVPAPIMNWTETTVQLTASMCPPFLEVTGLRYAWRDWPCDFKQCPIYGGILPAPIFTLNKYPALAKIRVGKKNP